MPIGGFAQLRGEMVVLEGMVGSLDGGTVFRESEEGPAGDADAVGRKLASRLIAMGALEVLEESRAGAAASQKAVLS